MKITFRAVLCVLAVVVIGACQSSSAQDYLYSTGSPTWGMQIPVENGFINVNNGNIHFEISLATHQQRGTLKLNEKLVYDSRIWQIVPSGSSYDWEPTNVADAQGGWRFIKGNETGNLEVFGNPTTAICPENQYQQFTYYTYSFKWTDPTGTAHEFPVGTVQMASSQCTSWPNGQYPDQPTGSSYADDAGTYYMMVSNYTTAVIYDKSGNQVYPTVTDTNGNTFTSDSNGNLIDTIGRTPVLVTPNGNETYYDVLTINGDRKRYTVTTETINVNTAFGQSGVNDYSGSFTAIQSIALPDGSQYSFNYDSGTSSGNYGELTSITLPTGGTVSLTYQNYLDSYQNENRWIDQYSGGNGSYSFWPQVVTQCTGSTKTGCQEDMTVTDGNGNSVLYQLTLNNGAWNSQMNFNNGGTQVATTATTYNFSNSCASWDTQCTGSNYITASNTVTTLSDTGQKAQTVYNYSNVDMYDLTSVQEWDYFSGTAPSTATRETDYTYNYSVNGALFVTQEVRKDSTSTPKTQITYNYDEGESGTHGNLTTLSAGLSPDVVATHSQYDSNGMKTSDTDGRGNQISYSYMCSDLYRSTTTYPVTVNGQALKTTDTYDCNSGLLTGSQDMNGAANGLSTTYTYFTSGTNLGRLQAVSYPDGGSKSYSYPSNTESDVTTAQSGTSSVINKTILDSFGRPYQKISSAPEGSGWISSETTYDATGRPSQVTNAHLQGTGNSTDGTTTNTYDVLGRIVTTTMPDQNIVSHSYSGASETITDEVGHKKQLTYDAFHRLVKVLEPDANNNLSYETDYAYKALDKLIQVDQWGGAYGSGSPGDRVRKYAYDSLGRERAENIPENQSGSNGASQTCTNYSGSWTSCFTYDGNGNTQTATDNASNTVTYTYDPLNRITSEVQTGGSGSLSYSFAYDGTDGYSHTNPIGHLTFTTNNNAHAAEVLSYDSMGRVTGENVCVPSNCVFGGSGINVGASYDKAGNLISLTYPDGRVVSQSFDTANRLTGVQYAKWGGTNMGSSYYSASSFAPPGEPTAVSFGNSGTLSASYNDRLTIASLAFSNSSGTQWSKQFTWDKNAKNLSVVADQITGYKRQFGYDTLNRVTSAVDVSSVGAYATATLTISGNEQSTLIYTCPMQYGGCPQTIYDSGGYNVTVNGVGVGGFGWGSGSTSDALASSLASSINGNSSSNVTAVASRSSVILTSKTAGPNYSISVTCTGWSSYFSSPSFTVSSPSSMSGGVYPGGDVPGGLNETYAYDPFGNLTQAGSFSFSQSFSTLNQVNGYGYDAKGEESSDIYGHSLTYDATGMLTNVAGSGETYTYNADGTRAEIAGSITNDFIYFDGHPIAVLSGGSYTDLIYANNSLIAEVSGSQNASPQYRASDNLGSFAGYLGSSGSLGNAVDYAPYGQAFNGSSSDMFGFTGLQWDSTTAELLAQYRQFSSQQGRWMTADPYNGSYDLEDPQSLSRYVYVGNRPLGYIDPEGLVAGWATGLGGSPCKAAGRELVTSAFSPGGFNLCTPVAAAIAFAFEPVLVPLANQLDNGLDALFGTKAFNTNVTAGQIVPFISAAITIACSIYKDQSACGTSLTSFIPGNWGKAVGDGIAVATAISCSMGGLGNPVCDGFVVYNIANAIYGLFAQLFGGGPAFQGSLAPRPSVPNESDIGTILGIPINAHRVGSLPSPVPVVSQNLERQLRAWHSR
ncbi:MAG: RHS repeat-associated core domain-containing protein [Acidobacteriota bacterium]